MARPRLLASNPQEAWDPVKDPEEVYLEPDNPARNPWDVGWLLGEGRPMRPRSPRPQPRLGWGSSTSVQDNPLDHHNHLQGTWIPRPEDTTEGELEAGEELTQDMEQSGQHPVPALRDRSVDRSMVLSRPTRRISGKASIQGYNYTLAVHTYTSPNPVFPSRLVPGKPSVWRDWVQDGIRQLPSLHWVV